MAAIPGPRAHSAGFGLSELAERAGVPVPTIHHYRKLGLLPRARRRSANRLVYDERHVAALSAIRALRAHQVPLDKVRRVLPRVLECSTEGLSAQGWAALVADGSGADPTAERLLEVARASFARHGYDGVSVSEICDRARVAKGTFYRYFVSKDALFVAAARSTVEAVGRELDRRGGSMSERQALGELEALLTPFVPLLLEAATRELRDQPRSAGILTSIAQGLAGRLGPRLRAKGSRALPTARRVVETVILGLVRPALGIGSR